MIPDVDAFYKPVVTYLLFTEKILAPCAFFLQVQFDDHRDS